MQALVNYAVGAWTVYGLLITFGGIAAAFRSARHVPLWTWFRQAKGPLRWVWRAYLLYSTNVLLALDRSLNARRGGDPNETLSGAMGKAILDKRCWLCVPVCWILSKLDNRGATRGGHCVRAVSYSVGAGSQLDRRVIH